MARRERVREPAPAELTPEHVEERKREGWKLVALEWERQVETEAPALVEVPYGWKVAADAKHLEESPEEQAALALMMEMIVQENTLAQIAAELNRRGMTTRAGYAWSQTAVFDMLPRLVESGPRILTSPEWPERRRVHAG